MPGSFTVDGLVFGVSVGAAGKVGVVEAVVPALLSELPELLW